MKGPFIPTAVRGVVGLSFVAVGALHFVDPGPFVRIVPPALPAPETLVYLSGFFEIAGGLGLLVERTRRMAAWGLLGLLIAVYPANVHMLVNEVYLEGMPHERWLLWARMPMQLVFAAGVLWAGGIWPPAGERRPPRAVD